MKWILAFLVLALFSGGGFVRAFAEIEEEENLITVETKEGLRFEVPSDRPIVKRNGVVAPIPMDEYLHQKMKTLLKRIDELDQKVEAVIDRVDRIEKEARSY